jgi:phosphate transport system substrate-binding protein
MRKLFIGVLLMLSFVTCKTNNKTAPQDTPSSGFIRISAEQSFKPILEEQLKVFLSAYPTAKIEIAYKSEIDCFKDLASDSTRMIMVTRGLTKQEEANYKTQLSFTPTFGILAYNAIAILMNKNNSDSLYTLSQLHEILTGKKMTEVVMDGNNLTGIVRFLKDSLVKKETFGKNVVAANGSKEVIEYIKKHPNAIGFVAMNWVEDSYDPKQVEDRKELKTALLECTLCTEKGLYAHPSQATIGKGQYSLSLPVYYILKENAPGLGSGFLNFMSLERGQLIFRRSFLVPAKMGFSKRNGMIS